MGEANHKYSLKNKRLSPEEDVIHHLAAGLGIQDPIEMNLTIVLALGLKVPSLKDAQRQLCVQPTQVIPIGPVTLVQTRKRGGREGEKETDRQIETERPMIVKWIAYNTQTSVLSAVRKMRKITPLVTNMASVPGCFRGNKVHISIVHTCTHTNNTATKIVPCPRRNSPHHPLMHLLA